MKLIKDKTVLRQTVPERTLTDTEISNVKNTLVEELTRHGGLGLASNQIGLDVRACIINVIEPIILINPRIVERSTDNLVYAEQCLSLDSTMKKPRKTVRSRTVVVHSDNMDPLEFSPTETKWKGPNEYFGDLGLLECVTVQHEIDHLDGKLMIDKDRTFSQTVIAPKKYGRNDKVMVKLTNGETEFMKYKKAEPLLEFGCEII